MLMNPKGWIMRICDDLFDVNSNSVLEKAELPVICDVVKLKSL